MTERELAKQLAVGRSSIREAITALRVRVEVEVCHGDCIYLVHLPEDVIGALAAELVETHVDHPAIWETRQVLETQCARLAAVRAMDEDLAELEAALDDMEREIASGEPGLAGDRRFHSAVASASHNPILIRLLDSVRQALDRTSATSLTRTGQPAASLPDHRRILDEIRAGAAVTAANAMLEHLVSKTDSLIMEGQVRDSRVSC